MYSITWDYDFKKVLLTNNYYTYSPIKNILNAKKGMLHIENLKEVKDIFKVLFNDEDAPKDIMNSFWFTYKSLLQLHYPLIFAPQKYINETANLQNDSKLIDVLKKKSVAMQGRTPYTNDNKFPQQFVAYFKNNFPLILQNEQSDEEKYKYNINLDVCTEDTWLDFLLKNFEQFPLVHRHEQLNHFSVLTHSIGNMTVVPKGFNSSRQNGDYWDYAMQNLKEQLGIENLELFIQKYKLSMYVSDMKSLTIIPFWEDHLTNNVFTPSNTLQIEDFLINVNQYIEKRGKSLIKEYNRKLLEHKLENTPLSTF